jgi:tetratricopeptide (TPR) repeat protein
VEAGKQRWEERATRAQERYEDGHARLPEDGDERQRQLTRMGNAAWAAGLSYLMLGRRDEAAEWLGRAAERYRDSWPEAPPGSWGRPIGAMKSRLLAGDPERAREEARWALDAGAAESESPIGRYAAALASLVLGDDARAGALAASIEGRDEFPAPVAEALAAVAAADREPYEKAIRALLEDFESREDFLEDVPVADTVLVLQSLAAERDIEVALESPLLPG